MNKEKLICTNSKETINSSIEIGDLESTEFAKSRFDSFSFLCLTVIVTIVLKLIINGNSSISKIESHPIQIIIYVFVFLYPILLYFASFHSFKINSKGFTLENNKFLRWIDVDSIYENENLKKEGNSKNKSSYIKFTINLKKNHFIELDLSNYKISDKESSEAIKPYLKDGWKMKNLIVLIFLMYYEKSKLNNTTI